MLNGKHLLIGFFALSLLLYSGCLKQQTSDNTPSGSDGPSVNKTAPAFTLLDSKDQSVELKSFNGKKGVLVVFWSSG